MSKIIAVLLFVVTGSIPAFAQKFSTPLQSSANIHKAVIAHLLEEARLEMMSISKISTSNDHAKAQLLDTNGNCTAIPFNVKADALGKYSVTVNAAAFAQCD